MTLKAVIEAVLHLESFRNIELFYQGLYFLKVKMYSERKTSGKEEESDRVYAQPYCSFISQIQMEKNTKMLSKGLGQAPTYDHHNLLLSKIHDEENCFQSKTFLIRYCEEEVEINDIILFRAELDVEPDYLNTEFYLEIELHFSNLDSIGGSEQWQEIAHCIEEKVEFKLVQTQKFKIHCLAQGMTEFVPVNFQDQYFSILNCYLQSVLLDYRYRLGGKTNKAESVAHFFFSDDYGQLPSTLDLREVDLIYNDYIRVMTIMFEKLKTNYNTFITRFLTEEQRRANNITVESNRFALP